MSSSMVYARSAQRDRPAESTPFSAAFTTARGRVAHQGLAPSSPSITARRAERHGQSANRASLCRKMLVLYQHWPCSSVRPLWSSVGTRTPGGAWAAGGYGEGRRGERCAWTMSSALRLIYRDGSEYVRSAASVAGPRARPLGTGPALRAARFPPKRSGLCIASVGRHRPGRQSRDSAGHRNDLRGA
jgi:hypothetical protein